MTSTRPAPPPNFSSAVESESTAAPTRVTRRTQVADQHRGAAMATSSPPPEAAAAVPPPPSLSSSFATTPLCLDRAPAFLLDPSAVLADLLAYLGPGGASKLRTDPELRERIGRLEPRDLPFPPYRDSVVEVILTDLRTYQDLDRLADRSSSSSSSSGAEAGADRVLLNCLTEEDGGRLRLSRLGMLALARHLLASERALRSLIRCCCAPPPATRMCRSQWCVRNLDDDEDGDEDGDEDIACWTRRLVLDAVASNPAASAEVLDLLARRLLADCRSDAEPTEEARARARGSSSGLCCQARIRVLRSVLLNPNACPRTLTSVASLAPFSLLLEEVASDPRATPARLSTFLAYHEGLDKRVAGNPSTGPADLARLAQRHPDPSVRSVAAGNPSTPPEALRAYVAAEEDLLSVARNPSAPADCLDVLGRHDDRTIRRGVASNPASGPDVLARLAGDDELSVRLAVATNPTVRVADVCGDDEGGGREGLLASLGARAIDEGDVEVAVAVARDVRNPAEVLVGALSASPRDELRTWVEVEVARNVRTPAEVLTALSLSPLSEVRDEVARNVRTPAEVLVALSASPWDELRDGVAQNVNAPHRALRALSTDSDADVRASVGRNPACPSGILDALARDDDEWVRQSVACNKATSAAALRALSRSESADVRCAAAANPRLPACDVVRMSSDPSPRVRHRLASNPTVQWAADRLSCSIPSSF